MDEREKQKIAADVLLNMAGVDALSVARLALELKESIPPQQMEDGRQELSPMLCRHVLRKGAASLRNEERSVPFREAVEKSLLGRHDRRARTLLEIRQYSRRIARCNPMLWNLSVRSIDSELCQEIIEEYFHTPSTQRKARRLLHGIFSFAVRRGWCRYNPVAAVRVPEVSETTVEVLTIAQVRRLLATVRKPEFLPCAPAVGFMLWAGIRPTEITRLRWRDVKVEDRVIAVDSNTSKTGGARHVRLYPVLIKWLQETAPFRLPNAFIVPTSWIRRWHALRVAAGFTEWHPDALRHTFASYHLRHFDDLNRLQVDMGHASLRLLRTRYLAMRNVTQAGAAEFWGQPRARRWEGRCEGR